MWTFVFVSVPCIREHVCSWALLFMFLRGVWGVVPINWSEWTLEEGASFPGGSLLSHGLTLYLLG